MTDAPSVLTMESSTVKSIPSKNCCVGHCNNFCYKISDCCECVCTIFCGVCCCCVKKF